LIYDSHWELYVGLALHGRDYVRGRESDRENDHGCVNGDYEAELVE
jgi:hypothetical protein